MLLNDSITGDLDFRLEALSFHSGVDEFDVHPRLPRIPLQETFQSGDQPEIVEGGRAEVERQRPYAAAQLVHGAPRLLEPAWTAATRRGCSAACRSGQDLPDLVVKLAGDLFPGRLLHFDQPSRQASQRLLGAFFRGDAAEDREDLHLSARHRDRHAQRRYRKRRFRSGDERGRAGVLSIPAPNSRTSA